MLNSACKTLEDVGRTSFGSFTKSPFVYRTSGGFPPYAGGDGRKELIVMTEHSVRPSRRSLLLLSLGHLLTDIHGLFIPVLLPEIVPRLGISLTAAGLLNSVGGFVNMMGQLVFGHFSDRTARPVFMALGPLCAALGAGLLPFASSYGVVLLCVGLWSVGVSSFHPQGQGSLGHLVPPDQLPLALSIFGAAGMLGSTLSAHYALGLMHFFGAQGLIVAVGPTVIYGAALLFFLPQLGGKRPAASPQGFFRNVSEIMGRIMPLWVTSLLLDAAFSGIRFFLPLWITRRGGSLADGGHALFMATLAATLASLASGFLAQHLGPRRLMLSMVVLAPVLLLGATWSSGIWSMTLLILGFAALSAPLPLIGAMAQAEAPHARSMVSALVLGVTWGLGGLVTVPAGALADRWGLEVALRSIALLPLGALVYLLLGWGKKKQAHPGA